MKIYLIKIEHDSLNCHASQILEFDNFKKLSKKINDLFNEYGENITIHLNIKEKHKKINDNINSLLGMNTKIAIQKAEKLGFQCHVCENNNEYGNLEQGEDILYIYSKNGIVQEVTYGDLHVE